MTDEKEASTDEAIRRILRFIEHRPRTGFEVGRKLRDLSYDRYVSDEVITLLKQKGLVDDERFTRIYTDELLRKKYGYKRILNELSNKGIDKNVIEKFKQNYPYDTEIERAKEACQKKLLKNMNPESYEEKRKIIGYLIRRGFNREIAEEAIEELIG